MRMFKGEKRAVGVTVTRLDGAAFTIATATYEVYTAARVAVESGSATIAGADAYFLLDSDRTSGSPPVASYAANKSYLCYLELTITGEDKVFRQQVVVEILP